MLDVLQEIFVDQDRCVQFVDIAVVAQVASGQPLQVDVHELEQTLCHVGVVVIRIAQEVRELRRHGPILSFA
jgi:hypothetical protein